MIAEYPEVIEIAGVEYEINTDYRFALACFACINDPDISAYERALGIIGLLYKDEPPDAQEALKLALKYLRCGTDEEDTGDKKPDMDFECDMNYIRSSFRSDFNIDLIRTDMHWFEFCELLQGLTDDCILNRVREIRNRDISEIKDIKSRQKVIKAQQEVQLPERLNKKSKDIIDNFYSQLK